MEEHGAESAQGTGLDDQVSKDEEPGHPGPGRQGLQSQGPERPSPPVANLQQLVNAYNEIGRQAMEAEDIDTEAFYRILRTALGSLCQRFPEAYTLSRPHVMWEVLVVVEEELQNIHGIPIWATTSLTQPSIFDEPISGNVYNSLEKILDFSTADTLFHNIKEWCMTGRVTELGIEDYEPFKPQDPKPAENKKPAKSAGGQKKQQQQQQQQKKKPAQPTRGQKKKPTEPTRGQDKKPAQSETSPESTAQPPRGRLAAPAGRLSAELGPQPTDLAREEEEDLQMAIQLSLQEAGRAPSHGQPAAAPTAGRTPRQQLPYADWRPDLWQTPVPTGPPPGPERLGLVARRSRARTPTGYTPPPPDRAADAGPQTEEGDSSSRGKETRPAKKRRLG